MRAIISFQCNKPCFGETFFKIVKIETLDQTHANIIKEEMVKVGSDAAISVDAWNKKQCTTDVILFGTLKQYEEFLHGIEKRELFSLAQQIKNLILY